MQQKYAVEVKTNASPVESADLNNTKQKTQQKVTLQVLNKYTKLWKL